MDMPHLFMCIHQLITLGHLNIPYIPFWFFENNAVNILQK